MFNLAKVIFICGVVLLLEACATTSYDGPSPEARSMAGAEGRFDFKPMDWQEGDETWWKDTDGVDPGTPGCPICTDGSGAPNGRMFAEACLDGSLVESNPGAGVIHVHPDDTGHPDKFDCNAWCVGQGKAKGSCVIAAAPLCAHSAKCACE
jgi:hypothetical protein